MYNIITSNKRYLIFGGVAGLDGMGVGATSVLSADGNSWKRSL